MTEKTPLFRQINPNFVQNGQPSYIAFRPFPRDEGHLSVYDGDLITAEGAHKHFTEIRKLKSEGVLAVVVQECKTLELPACSSPEQFPEHAHIDFNGLEKKEIDSKSKGLLAFAVARDWVFRKE